MIKLNFWSSHFFARPSAWYVHHPCIRNSTTGEEQNCTYYFSICHALPEQPAELQSGDAIATGNDVIVVTGGDVMTTGRCENAGVCERNNEEDQYESIGTYTNNLNLGESWEGVDSEEGRLGGGGGDLQQNRASDSSSCERMRRA